MDGPTRQALLPNLCRASTCQTRSPVHGGDDQLLRVLAAMAGIAIETIGVGGAFGVSLIGHVW